MSFGSFKLRLVAYFVLLALVPLAAVSWAFGKLVESNQTNQADARLDAGVRVAVGEYRREVEDLERTAESLAGTIAVRGKVGPHTRAAIVRSEQVLRNTVIYVHGRRLAGSPPTGLAVQRSAPIESESGRRVGRVLVWLPVDTSLVDRLEANAGLDVDDRLVLARGGRVYAGPPELVDEVAPPLGHAGSVRLGRRRFRAVAASLPGSPSGAFVALAPQASIDDAVGRVRKHLLELAIIALAIAAFIAYVLGRPVVRSLRELAAATGDVARGQFDRRVRVRGHDELAALGRSFNEMAEQLAVRDEELTSERTRVSAAIARFGDALAATHDPYTLLPVIVESTVEATGAVGGRLRFDGREIVSGVPEAGGPPLEIPLGDAGDDAVLMLTPTGSDFTDDARERAYWLGKQASIALENARLHRQLALQAVTDGLTELPNRRQFEDALEGEVNRVERFGGSLGLIFADLDDFKQVNDRYGHQAGDEVLRAFAQTLRGSLREIDLPSRFGGDEFAVLLPQTDLVGAEHLAERLREALAARPVQIHSRELLAVTASFGVAAFPAVETRAGLLAAADEALYRAKARGKGCVAVAGDETLAVPEL